MSEFYLDPNEIEIMVDTPDIEEMTRSLSENNLEQRYPRDESENDSDSLDDEKNLRNKRKRIRRQRLKKIHQEMMNSYKNQSNQENNENNQPNNKNNQPNNENNQPNNENNQPDQPNNENNQPNNENNQPDQPNNENNQPNNENNQPNNENNQPDQPNNENNQPEQGNNENNNQDNNENRLLCRICHDTIELPREIEEVISPCRCRGSQEMVHIECFNMWGRARCEICHFRFYAGEVPPAPRRRGAPIRPLDDLNNLNIDDIDINFPEPIQLNVDDNNPPDLGFPPEINQLLNVYIDRVPEEVDGFRMRLLYRKIMTFVGLMYLNNLGFFVKFWSMIKIFSWVSNEFFRIGRDRSNVISLGLLFISYGLVPLTTAPFLYLYHLFFTHLSVKQVLLHLAGIASLLLASDLALDLANYYITQDRTYQTGSQMMISYLLGHDGICHIGQSNSPNLNFYYMILDGLDTAESSIATGIENLYQLIIS